MGTVGPCCCIPFHVTKCVATHIANSGLCTYTQCAYRPAVLQRISTCSLQFLHLCTFVLDTHVGCPVAVQVHLCMMCPCHEDPMMVSN